jgi:hypothetical protein
MVTILLDLAFRRSGQIEPLRADPRIYDHVLFLAPSWNRHIATPMRAAMRHLAPEVGAYSFVTLCGGDRPRQSDTVRLKATSAAGRPPLHQKEIWLEQQRAATEDDLDAMRPEIDTIVGFSRRRDAAVHDERWTHRVYPACDHPVSQVGNAVARAPRPPSASCSDVGVTGPIFSSSAPTAITFSSAVGTNGGDRICLS